MSKILPEPPMVVASPSMVQTSPVTDSLIVMVSVIVSPLLATRCYCCWLTWQWKRWASASRPRSWCSVRRRRCCPECQCRKLAAMESTLVSSSVSAGVNVAVQVIAVTGCQRKVYRLESSGHRWRRQRLPLRTRR